MLHITFLAQPVSTWLLSLLRGLHPLVACLHFYSTQKLLRDPECCCLAGRPADVLPMPDGSVLVSDDQNGALYRITYSEALANMAAVNATADSANFTDRVLPELQLAPAPDVSEMVPSMVAAQTAG